MTREALLWKHPILPSNQVQQSPRQFPHVYRIAKVAGSIQWPLDRLNYRQAVEVSARHRVANSDEWNLWLACAEDVYHFASVPSVSWCKHTVHGRTNAQTMPEDRTYYTRSRMLTRTRWIGRPFHWINLSVVHTRAEKKIDLRKERRLTCTVWTWTFWILRTANSHIVTRGK